MSATQIVKTLLADLEARKFEQAGSHLSHDFVFSGITP